MTIKEAEDISQKALSDDALDKYRRADLGPLNFALVVPLLKSIKKDLFAYSRLNHEDIPSGTISTTEELMRDLGQCLRFMHEWDPSGTENATSDRAKVVESVTRLRDNIAERVRPLARADMMKIESSQEYADQRLDEAFRLVAQAEEEASNVQEISKRVREREEELIRGLQDLKDQKIRIANEEVGEYFSRSAGKHKRVAFWYGASAVVLGSLAAAGVVLLFFVSHPLDQAIPTQALIRELAGRILLLVLLSIGLTFCMRNYRINKHLEVTNSTRVNALNTASLYVESQTGDDARNIVVAELVRSIFGPIETGYITSEREQTIIEGAGSLTSVILANKKP